MAKVNVAQIPAKLYGLLEPLSPDERTRAVQATMILFGAQASTPPNKSAEVGTERTGEKPGDPSSFFKEKNPENKGEILAVAARYRERQGHESHSKADLKAVITGSRRNFDDHNFVRDMNNAKRQAKFFNLGTDREAHTLSYYGQQYVDALPDRVKAAELTKPKVGGKKKSAAKAKAKSTK